jgi:putative MATE family efflux protein
MGLLSPSRHSISRQLFDLSAPLIGLNVLLVLALAIDTVMLGHHDSSTVALTALGYATQLIFLLMVAMIGLSVGTVALVARAHGASDGARVNHVLAQSTLLTVSLGIAVAIFGNLVAAQLLRWLGASPPVVESGLLYLRPLLLGTTFAYLYVLYNSVLRGVGNTRLPFFVSLVTTLINVGLNAILIYGRFGIPELGIRGAAIGTVISQLCGAAILFGLLRRGRVANLRLSFARVAAQGRQLVDRSLVRELMRIGAPAALDMVLLNAGFLSLIGMLGHIDERAVAAHGIGLRIQTLAFVPGLSIAQVTSALVGQALGAGSMEQARGVLRASLWMCTSIMSGLAMIIVVAAYPIVSLFDVASGSELERYSIMWMYILGASMPLTGITIAFIGVFQGAGATGLSLRINMLATLLIQIPLAAVLGFVFDWRAFGVWLAFPLAFSIKIAVAVGAYRSGRWAKTGLHA